MAFSERFDEFKKINTEVVACSVDSHFTHLAWINTPRKEGGLGKINIPLLSDLTHSIAKDYGVYLEDLGHTLRGLFIIDDKGILRQITMNDLPVGRSVDETLRLVQAFQYTDNHGEVCPAGWKPGQDTVSFLKIRQVWLIFCVIIGLKFQMCLPNVYTTFRLPLYRIIEKYNLKCVPSIQIEKRLDSGQTKAFGGCRRDASVCSLVRLINM